MFLGSGREMPGSVTLKSSIPMEYSRPVLTNIWFVFDTDQIFREENIFLFFRHQKREAEPKDNDINHLPVRNMHVSTYEKLADDGEVRQENFLLTNEKRKDRFLRRNCRDQQLKINKHNRLLNDHNTLNNNIHDI